jgi:hypothetical protein
MRTITHIPHQVTKLIPTKNIVHQVTTAHIITTTQKTPQTNITQHKNTITIIIAATYYPI